MSGLVVMTPQQVADVLQVHVDWVYEECRRGLPHLRAGRNIRLIPDEVFAYLHRSGQVNDEE